jgi:hypothetical protein
MRDDRLTLEVLRSELAYIEKGGYRRVSRYPWRPNFVFQDSPTCLNYEDRGKPRPCSECLLIQFVPQDRRETHFPCRHIKLTSSGETVNSFYEWGTEEEMEAALKSWITKTIKDLEFQDGLASQ